MKVWGIPEGGITENITEPLVDLVGHQRKTTHVEFHPTAQHVLATTSADYLCKIWDIEKARFSVVSCARRCRRYAAAAAAAVCLAAV